MRDFRGFTLIELLVVITLLGIFAAVFGARYMDRSDQAKAALAVTFLGGQLPTALMTFSEIRGRIDNVSKTDLVAASVPNLTSWGANWTVEADTVLTDNQIVVNFPIGASDTTANRSLANDVLLRLQNATDFPYIVSVVRSNNQLAITYRGA